MVFDFKYADGNVLMCGVQIIEIVLSQLGITVFNYGISFTLSKHQTLLQNMQEPVYVSTFRDELGIIG